MEQIKRIIYMEQIFDEATEVVFALSKAVENYKAVLDKLNELDAYYTCEQWRQDFDDDSSGKIPKEVKRGILSEDAIYNLLAENDDLKKRLKELIDKK